MDRITKELNIISQLLNTDGLSSRHYEQLYASQQGIAWAVNPDLAKSPVETVMSDLVQAPDRRVTDTQANSVNC